MIGYGASPPLVAVDAPIALFWVDVPHAYILREAYSEEQRLHSLCIVGLGIVFKMNEDLKLQRFITFITF